ncbi:Ribosomal L1 domain-containing protein 1 [Sesamum alatum]|uniref:Ribosomal L1 domain-containing protein 1 n=1 Tax=Sesamum alatum TaxID=300844 RepID=A0AAE1Y559_9LAMI|nr:Ribosomal L1 domain-containing protein 1 [Sesamum alatum]
MAVAGRDRIKEDVVRKAVNALLKWKKKKKLYSQSDHEFAHEREEEEEEEDGDDFIYLSVTLKKVPTQDLTRTPHQILLRHSLLSQDYSNLNCCLIVDGKKITSETAHKMLKAKGIPSIKQVLKVSKLKSDYKSFDSKKKLYDSFDVFLAVKSVVPLLPKVLGKVFYSKKKKIPVPVDLRADGSNWKEEIEKACKSSLLWLSGGTCSALRVGRWGLTESEEIVENVFEAIAGVLEIVPKKWGGIRCFHLKFSDSLALPVYDYQQMLQPDDDKLGRVGDGGSGLV